MGKESTIQMKYILLGLIFMKKAVTNLLTGDG